MKAFSDPNTEEKYLKLGFVPDGPSLKLTVGKVAVYAVEHPWKGAALTLESCTPRTMTQYTVACPTKCGRVQIAGLIYMNVAQNFRDSAEAFKTHPTTWSFTFPMSQHSEPEKKHEKKPQEALDMTSSGALGGLGSEATRRLFRYYNPATGKCDLMEEQANERAHRREIYNREVGEEVERRRQEHLERWRNTPLEPEAKEALDGLPPALVWQQIQELVFQAFDLYADQAQKLMDGHHTSPNTIRTASASCCRT